MAHKYQFIPVRNDLMPVYNEAKTLALNIMPPEIRRTNGNALKLICEYFIKVVKDGQHNRNNTQTSSANARLGPDALTRPDTPTTAATSAA